MSEDAKTIFTGERFVPGIEDSELNMEHYQRYESILPIVKDKVVVDAACGEGYGTAIIGSVARKVTGLDIEAAAVARAKEKYEKDTVSFVVGDIASLPFEENSVDVFVSFETIEHVPEKIQQAFLPQVKKVLKEDGIFIVSTPNKEIYSDLFRYQNEYHVHEFYKQEFVDLLKSYFVNVKLFHQYSEVAMILDSNESYQATAAYKKNRESYTSDGKYFVAVASNANIDDVILESVYLNENVTYRNNVQRILQLQDAEEERNQHIKHLDGEIEEKNKYIDILRDEKQNLNQNITDLNLHMAKMNSKLADVNVLVAQKSLEVEELSSQLKKKNEECCLLQENSEVLDYQLKEANRLVQAKDVHIRNLESMIQMKENHIQNITPGYNRWMKLTRNPVAKAIRSPKKVLRKLYHIYKDMTKYEKLEFQKEKNPLVSIIIPVYNQFEYTYQCLQSILEHTKDVPYEVIIADDVSTDRTKRIDRLLSNVKVIHNEKNLRFLLNCNHAAQKARGQYIFFLNNDTQVTEGWLSSLVKLIETDEKIGMVGSKLIYPNGVLQEAGGIIWSDGSGWNYGRNDDASKPEYNYVREVDYISGAAILIRRKLWEEIGGFDELFVPAYYEDTDLAFEVRKHGYKVMYQPKSVVIHFEGMSNGTDINSGLKKYQADNCKKFYEKWKTELAKQCESGTEVFKAKERLQDKKVVLFLDHYVPMFDKDAGSRSVFQYLKIFLMKGYSVKFIGDNYFPHQPYTEVLQQMGIEVYVGNWYAEHMFEYLKENEAYIDYIFANRPHITMKYLDFFKKEMHAKIIYYGHDLHYLRLNREYEISGDEEKLKESRYWKKIEYDIMRQVDRVFYLSEVEKSEILKEDATIPVRVTNINIFEKFLENIEQDFSKREGLLFVGGFSHTPNIDAIRWFVNEVYPLIFEKIQVPLYVIGSNPTDEVKAMDSENIHVLGFVSDEKLAEMYATCKVAVVPLRYGAGVKGKVIESLYNGIPLVTTSIGAEGVPGIEERVIIEDETEKFAEAVVNVYRDNERLKNISIRTQEFVKEFFSVDAVWKMVEEDFK